MKKNRQTTETTKQTTEEFVKTRRAEMARMVALAGGVSVVAEKIHKSLGLTVNGAKTAIFRTIKGMNSTYNAGKVFGVVEAVCKKGNGKEHVAKDRAKMKPTAATNKRENYNTGGTPISEEDSKKMLEQLSYIKHEMMRHGVAVWRLSQKIYKQLGVENPKQASSRIYRALKLSGYKENVEPVLNFLYAYFKDTFGNQDEKATKKQTAPATETTSEQAVTAMLRDIKAAIVAGQTNMQNILMSLPTDFARMVNLDPMICAAAIESIINYPDGFISAAKQANNGSFEEYTKGITSIWKSLPKSGSASFKEVVRGMLTEMQKQMDVLAKMVE